MFVELIGRWNKKLMQVTWPHFNNNVGGFFHCFKNLMSEKMGKDILYTATNLSFQSVFVVVIVASLDSLLHFSVTDWL